MGKVNLCKMTFLILLLLNVKIVCIINNTIVINHESFIFARFGIAVFVIMTPMVMERPMGRSWVTLCVCGDLDLSQTII